MTDALLVATHLRQLTDEALTRLLRARGVSESARLNDFFDVAEHLLERQRIERALRACDRRMLLALSAAADVGDPHSVDELTSRIESFGAGEGAVAEAADGLARAEAVALIVVDDRVRPLDAVSLALRDLRDRGLPQTADLADHPPAVLNPVGESERVDALAGEHAFTTTTAAGEIITELLRAPAKELGRGGLALPDTRRLAAVVGCALESVDDVLSTAASAGLVALDDRRWAPTTRGIAWLEQTTTRRWAELADAWRAAVPDDLQPLLTARHDTRWASTMRAQAMWLYPIGGEPVRARVERVIAHAEALGVVADDALSRAGHDVIAGEIDAAAEKLRGTLPHEVSQVYVQDDLTVISPGPLLPARDARLRLMADIESRSQATTYRFSRASIDRALGTGEDEASIIAFLTELSLTGIPQPLRYLVSDVAAQHGLLRVREAPSGSGAAGSSIRSVDHDLLETLTVDQNLAPLGLRAVAPGRLDSRFARDVVFWALRDARYPVSAEDDNGDLIRITRQHLAPPTLEHEPDLTELVTRLRQSVRGTSAHPDDAWIVRQLELAVRSRVTVTVTVAMPNGSTVDLPLEPTGLGGGRLRGRDNAADVERTLPLASIRSVSRIDD